MGSESEDLSMGAQLAEGLEESQKAEALALVKHTDAPVVSRPQTFGVEHALAKWPAMMQLAHGLLASGFLPRHIQAPEEAAAIMLTGIELNLPTMYALRHIYVIDQKPSLDGSALQSLIYRDHGDDALHIIERGPERSVIDAKRRNQTEYTRFSFDMADAKRAGLAGKGPWSKYPQHMLHWRNVSQIANAMFSDSTAGYLLPEEYGATVEYDDAGNMMIDTTATPVAPAKPSRTPKAPVAPPLEDGATIEAAVSWLLPEDEWWLWDVAADAPVLSDDGDCIVRGELAAQYRDADEDSKARIEALTTGKAWMKVFRLAGYDKVYFATTSNPQTHKWGKGDVVSLDVWQADGKVESPGKKGGVWGRDAVRVQSVRPVGDDEPPAEDDEGQEPEESATRPPADAESGPEGDGAASPPAMDVARCQAEIAKLLPEINVRLNQPEAVTQIAVALGIKGLIKNCRDVAKLTEFIARCREHIARETPPADQAAPADIPDDDIPF